MAEHQLLDDKTIRDITDDAKRWEGHCADMGSQGLAANLALHIYALLADRDTLQQQLTATTERAARAEASAEALNAMLKRVAYDLSPHDLGYWGEVNALLESDQPGAALLADARAVTAALEQVQWAGQVTTSEGLHAACPVCHGVRGKGHVPDCAIGNALARGKARGWDKGE